GRRVARRECSARRRARAAFRRKRSSGLDAGHGAGRTRNPRSGGAAVCSRTAHAAVCPAPKPHRPGGRRCTQRGRPVTALLTEQPLVSEDRSAPTALPPIAAVRSAKSVGVVSYVDRLAASLDEIGVDYRPCERAPRGPAAHLHLANSSRRVLWDAATSPSPLVTVPDVLPRTEALTPFYRRLVYPLLRQATVTIVHSRFAADLLRRVNGEGARVEVIPHPVATFASLDRGAARRALGWEGETP